jgi:hypothetical protein
MLKLRGEKSAKVTDSTPGSAESLSSTCRSNAAPVARV